MKKKGCGETKKAHKAARRVRGEKKEVTDDSRCENVCVCGNILVDAGITRQQSERASEQMRKRRHMK